MLNSMGNEWRLVRGLKALTRLRAKSEEIEADVKTLAKIALAQYGPGKHEFGPTVVLLQPRSIDRPSWKDLAEELNGGPLPVAVIASHSRRSEWIEAKIIG